MTRYEKNVTDIVKGDKVIGFIKKTGDVPFSWGCPWTVTKWEELGDGHRMYWGTSADSTEWRLGSIHISEKMMMAEEPKSNLRRVTDVKVGDVVVGYTETVDVGGSREQREIPLANSPWTITKMEVCNDNGDVLFWAWCPSLKTADQTMLVYLKKTESLVLEKPAAAPPPPKLQGYYLTEQATGAMSNGTRAYKVNSDPGDAVGDGSDCTIVGSVRDGDDLTYYVEWDQWPGIASSVTSTLDNAKLRKHP